jgi:hypothetical protein
LSCATNHRQNSSTRSPITNPELLRINVQVSHSDRDFPMPWRVDRIELWLSLPQWANGCPLARSLASGRTGFGRQERVAGPILASASGPRIVVRTLPPRYTEIMCYAHMIRADLKAWLREYGASLDIATLEDLFLKRLEVPRDFRFSARRESILFAAAGRDPGRSPSRQKSRRSSDPDR